MLRYILRRIAWMIPTLLGITLVCFLLLRMAGGDPVAAQFEQGLRGQQISQEALDHLRKLYDLDKPWYVQYLSLLRRLVTLDLGTRWLDGRPIAEIIGQALPVTLLLSIASLVLAYIVAIPLGVYSAVAQHTVSDKAITLVLFVLYSLPSFWLGTMMIVFLASGNFVTCPWLEQSACFPLQGWHSFEGFERMSSLEQVKDVAWHLVLPVLALTYPAFAVLSRYMRAGMLETLRQDYIRTARAKGLSERAVVFGHAMRNGLIPIVTLLGLQLPELISGAVIIESIFGVRGMGYLALEAIRLPDYPLVITIVAFIAMITMLGTLLSDLLYVLVDPRIKLDARHG
jgi:peptide/nickel transport system permease protein